MIKILAMTMSVFIFANFVHAAPLKVVTTTTDLLWLVKKIGKENVSAESMLQGPENPHFQDPSPKFTLLVSNADLVVLVGLDLEIGWLPRVFARAGNAKVQPGGPGYIEAGKGITALEVSTGPVDRSMGDVHPHGNPHFWLSPKVFTEASVLIAKKLAELDPVHSSDYTNNQKIFASEMDKIFERNLTKIKGAIKPGSTQVLEYHKEFTYFFNAYGIGVLTSLEEKPGVLPNAKRIGQVATMAKSADAKLLLASSYAPRKLLEQFTRFSGVPFITAPVSIVLDQKSPFSDYAKLQDYLVDIVIASFKVKKDDVTKANN